MFKLRPDLTPAQLVGALIAGLPIGANLLRAFGVFDVSPEQLEALEQAAQFGALTAGALFVSDAALRAARNVHDAKVSAANVTAEATVVAASASGGAPAPGATGAVVAGVEDPDVERVPMTALPSDEQELAAPPPPPPDESNMPTQPSQVGLTDAEADDPPAP